MASPTLNVARYTALVSGIVYGFYHRRTLQQEHDAHKLEHAKHERQQLIADAKAAWRRKQESPDSSVVTDPDDPRFDLEKLLAKWEHSS